MSFISDNRKLFTPLRIGGIPTPLIAEYYAWWTLDLRGCSPLVHGNFVNVPGIFTPEHIRAWKAVTDAVHEKGAYMTCQLWHTGRFAVSTQLGGRQPLSSSATNVGASNPFTIKGRVPTETAKEMTLEDIAVTIEDHVHAAKCAIEAGFDAVEITAGNGYLCDQFLNSHTNQRTDIYGGSKENRARFALELLDAVIAAIGAERTALRFSPWGTVLMPLDADPISTFTYVLSEVEKRGIAYVCLTQPRTDLLLSEETKWGNLHAAVKEGKIAAKEEDITLRPFKEVLKKTPTLSTGGYDGENCFEEVERGELDAVTFARWFISNPDLVDKIRLGLKLTERDLKTTYSSGKEGYTDYPSGEVDVEEKVDLRGVLRDGLNRMKIGV